MIKAYNIKYKFTCYHPITKEEKVIYVYNHRYALVEEAKAQTQKEEIIGFTALAERLWTYPHVSYYSRRKYDIIETDLDFRYKSNDTTPYIFYLTTSYEETEISLQRVFDYHDSKLAIQYLKDHELNICPIGK